jgi:hypothetical protein
MEIIQYMPYFTKDEELCDKMLGEIIMLLKMMQCYGASLAAEKRLIEAAIESTMTGARLHHTRYRSFNHVIRFVFFMFAVDAESTWMAEMIDRVFDFGGADVLQVSDDLRTNYSSVHFEPTDRVLSDLLGSIQDRPDGRHYLLSARIQQCINDLRAQNSDYMRRRLHFN